MKIRAALSIMLLCVVSLSSAQTDDMSGTPWNERIFFGGNLGLQFGTITNIEVSPLVGYRVNSNLSAGIGLTYIYYKINFDNRPDYSTDIYGGRVFVRRAVSENIFLHAEYESLNFEFVRSDGSLRREWVPGMFLGGGFIQPVGRNVAFVAMALYNVLHDDLRSPYNSPLVIRIGINVGF